MEPYSSIDNLDLLTVYQQSRKLGGLIWRIVTKWDYLEQRTLGTQWTRATDSITFNIAEGYGRFHFNDSIRFYYYARGSFFEFFSQLTVAYDRGLISDQQYDNIKQTADQIPLELNMLIKRTKDNASKYNKSIN
jgi:four helix bundle protein